MAAVELPVTVSLKEAFSGTTRLLGVNLPNGQGCLLAVAIPPGADNGTRVWRIGDEGNGQAGGTAGNLSFVITVAPCPSFTRQGVHLFQQLTVPQAVLAQGGVVRVRTLEETLFPLTIKARTRDGQRFRLVGQGMPWPGQLEKRGGLYVTVTSQKPPEANAPSTLHEANPEDDLIALVVFAVVFLLGLGAGILLCWLILAQPKEQKQWNLIYAND
jgi:curved DNA-binding protein